MKNEILAVLIKHPGIRIRSIAGYVGASNFVVSRILYSMLKEGLVTKVYISQPERMDYYDIWYKA